MGTILLVEDDANLRYGLRFNLAREGHTVLEASSAEDALETLQRETVDLAILDVMLPGASGLELLEQIRAENRAFPVLMLTARGDESDAVAALRIGADDYVRKPFGVAELVARIDGLLRRSAKVAPTRTKVDLGPWTIDLDARIARWGDEEVQLTSTEAQLLTVLLEQDEAVPRERLLARVWGVGSRTPTRTLDNHVARLRRKLEEAPGSPRLLVTVHGLGYRLLR